MQFAILLIFFQVSCEGSGANTHYFRVSRDIDAPAAFPPEGRVNVHLLGVRRATMTGALWAAVQNDIAIAKRFFSVLRILNICNMPRAQVQYHPFL